MIKLKHYENHEELIRSNDKFIGKIFSSNRCGQFKVIGINKLYKGKIHKPFYICQFIDTGYECLALDTAILKGNVKDNYCVSVFNIGFLGDYDGKKGKDLLYKTWVQMLSRCYNEQYTNYRANCFVCDDWHCFNTFKNDCKQILGYKEMIEHQEIKYSLDKDFIFQGNNIYSKDRCCFIPQDLNSFILNTNKNRDYKFEGFYFRKDCKKYRASIRYKGKTKHIITTNNPKIAHEEYWKEKQKIAHILLTEKYSYVCEPIREIIYKRLDLKHIESAKELEKAINDGYFKILEEE